jgi:hypothetical protein
MSYASVFDQAGSTCRRWTTRMHTSIIALSSRSDRMLGLPRKQSMLQISRCKLRAPAPTPGIHTSSNRPGVPGRVVACACLDFLARTDMVISSALIMPPMTGPSKPRHIVVPVQTLLLVSVGQKGRLRAWGRRQIAFRPLGIYYDCTRRPGYRTTFTGMGSGWFKAKTLV